MTRVSAAEIKRVSITTLACFTGGMVDLNSPFLYQSIILKSSLDVNVVHSKLVGTALVCWFISFSPDDMVI